MALRELERAVGSNNLVTISYHIRSDPFQNSFSTGRANVYGVTGTPWIWCDGVYNQPGTYGTVHQDSVAFAGYYNSRHSVSSPVSITITGNYHAGNRTGKVFASVTNTGTDTLKNQKLIYVITENVPYSWGGLDTCFDLERSMMPNTMGLNMTLNPGATKADSQNFTLGSGWVNSRIKFVAFLQNGTPGEIRQGAWIPFSTLGVEGGAPIEPKNFDFSLAQNRPNPFKGTSEIQFSLPKSGEVRLALYDAQGRLVRILTEGTETAGTHSVTVSGLGSGVYFYRLEAGNTSLTRRMVVTK